MENCSQILHASHKLSKRWTKLHTVDGKTFWREYEWQWDHMTELSLLNTFFGKLHASRYARMVRCQSISTSRFEINLGSFINILHTGCPKKMSLLSGFEYLTLGGGVFTILLNSLNFFLVPKFLELFFTLKNTPPKVRNWKPDNRDIFLGDTL